MWAGVSPVSPGADAADGEPLIAAQTVSDQCRCGLLWLGRTDVRACARGGAARRRRLLHAGLPRLRHDRLTHTAPRPRERRWGGCVQIDSHSYFRAEWDVLLMDQWKAINNEHGVRAAYPANHHSTQQQCLVLTDCRGCAVLCVCHCVDVRPLRSSMAQHRDSSMNRLLRS